MSFISELGTTFFPYLQRKSYIMPTQPHTTAELCRGGALPSHYAKGNLAAESDLSLGRDTGSTLPGEITLSTHVPGDEHSAGQSAPAAPLLHTSVATRTSFYCTFFFFPLQ